MNSFLNRIVTDKNFRYSLGRLLAPACWISAVSSLLFLTACAPTKQFCASDYRVDFSQALAFGEYAELAYASDSAVFAADADSAFVFTGPQTGSRAILLRDDKDSLQWLAFRGTQTLEDVRSDANYAQAHDTSLHLQLHSGFLQATEDVLPQILPHLSPGYRLRVTGHSLGGAMAVIAALELQGQGWKPEVITFGQPKVTNDAGAERTQLNLVRFIHGQDIVTLIPPLDWAPGRNLGTYAHFGREVAINDSAGFECLNEHFSKRYNSTAWWSEAHPQSVADHSMSKYLAALKILAGKPETP